MEEELQEIKEKLENFVSEYSIVKNMYISIKDNFGSKSVSMKILI